MDLVGNVLRSNLQLQKLWDRDHRTLSDEILEEMMEVKPSFLTELAQAEIDRRNDEK